MGLYVKVYIINNFVCFFVFIMSSYSSVADLNSSELNSAVKHSLFIVTLI